MERKLCTLAAPSLEDGKWSMDDLPSGNIMIFLSNIVIFHSYVTKYQKVCSGKLNVAIGNAILFYSNWIWKVLHLWIIDGITIEQWMDQLQFPYICININIYVKNHFWMTLDDLPWLPYENWHTWYSDELGDFPEQNIGELLCLAVRASHIPIYYTIVYC